MGVGILPTAGDRKPELAIVKTAVCCFFACPRFQHTLTQGCSQEVRHQTLTLLFAGSNPATPAIYGDSLTGKTSVSKTEVMGSSPTAVPIQEDFMNDNFLDMLNAISVILGMQNLKENREQSAHNDVQIANAEQAKYLLTEISKQFEEQSKILSEQNVKLSEILNILKGIDL